MSPEIVPEVVLRARSADPAAFRSLVESLARFTFNLAWRIVSHAGDAEDLTQEIFLRLHRNLDRYDPTLPFLPWFRTLATNACLNWRRARPRPPSLDALEIDAAAPAGAGPRDTGGVLDREIARLPVEYRLALTYLYYEGLTVAQISEAMAAPPGTVKTWLFRAREALKEKLKPHLATLL